MSLTHTHPKLLLSTDVQRFIKTIALLIYNMLFLKLLTFNIVPLTGQKQLPVRFFDSLEYVSELDLLEEDFGTNKTIPENMKLEVLLTLSYFPELKNSQIKFKKGRIRTTLNARPTVFSVLFKNKENRKYIIRINKTRRDSMVTYNEVPFNAKIGLLSHEFTHFVDYKNKNIEEVAKRLMMYIGKENKRDYEHEIDSLVVARKLGWQLYDWSYFVLESSDASRDYKKFKKYTYLEPKEIMRIMYISSDPELLAKHYIYSSPGRHTDRYLFSDRHLNLRSASGKLKKSNELESPL